MSKASAKAAVPPTAKNSKNSKSKNGIQITGEGRYPLVPVQSIEIVERPAEGQEHSKLFYNPREIESFTPETMGELRDSIRMDALQQPPLVRAFTDGKDNVTKVELIAGERRLRSVQHIVEHDLPCFDEDAGQPEKYKAGDVVVSKGVFGRVLKHNGAEVTVQILDSDNKLTKTERTFAAEDVYPTAPGSKLYERIPCRVAYNISDQKALRLAFTENDKSKSLSTKEEIRLVERLGRMDLKVAEIAELLGTNETWVSQTANFRTALPETAFERLLDGTMKRHVAVNIMGYKPADRQKLFDATVKAEQEETAEKIKGADNEMTQAEDEELLALDEQQQAAKAGDNKGAAKAGRKAAGAASKAAKAREKKERAESESGQIKTGHVQKGASSAGINPKKAKILPKEEIEERYVTGMEEYLEGDGTDPLTGEEVPSEMAAIVRLTAIAIMSGNRDPLSPIRQYMVEQGTWEVKGDSSGDDEDDEYSDEEDEDDEDADGPSDEDLEALDADNFDEDDEDLVTTSRGRGRGRCSDFDEDDY